MTEQTDAQAPEAGVPTIQVTKGMPDELEAGAVMAVLAAALTEPAPVMNTDDRPLAGGWKSYYRTVRRQVAPGREAWRNTYRLG